MVRELYVYRMRDYKPLCRLVRPACNNFEILYEVTRTFASKDFEVVYSVMISLPRKLLKAGIRLKVLTKIQCPSHIKHPKYRSKDQCVDDFTEIISVYSENHVKHENTMWVKCKGCYAAYYTVIHIRVQYMSGIYCGGNSELNSSLIYVCEILYFGRDRQPSHTIII